jgi:hypothetical protein
MDRTDPMKVDFPLALAEESKNYCTGVPTGLLPR